MRRFGRSLVAAATLVATLVSSAQAARIYVLNANKPDVGFNDRTPALPVGGNPGTTLGQQRLIAARYAADIWGRYLESPVDIIVSATMDDLFCDTSSAVLGAAGTNCVHANFAGAPVPDRLYPAALANSLFGADLCPSRAGCQCPSADIEAVFNSAIGTTCGFGNPWYYGLDGAAAADEFDFVTVFLHELGHGLGFLTMADVGTGERFADLDDHFLPFLTDRTLEATWSELDDAGRAVSAVNDGNLVWNGELVTLVGKNLVTAGKHPRSGEVQMYAPSTLSYGSSVSHFDIDVSPDTLMEPFYTGPLHHPGMTLALLQDVGWTLARTCGNGVLEPGETCDDGNDADGDCCSSSCQLDLAATPCTSDGNVCTENVCNAQGDCVAVANDAACDDGVVCNGTDTCADGTCSVHSGDPCSEGAECNNFCDEETGSCLTPFGVSCADEGNPCTDDMCDGRGECMRMPNNIACDDGDPCTHGDVCFRARCVSGPVVPGCSQTLTVCGDASGDGVVLAGDALTVLRASVSLESCAVAVCDVTGDSRVTASDALLVLERSVDPQMRLTCAGS